MKQIFNNSSENAGVVHHLLIFCFIGLPKCYVAITFHAYSSQEFAIFNILLHNREFFSAVPKFVIL